MRSGQCSLRNGNGLNNPVLKDESGAIPLGDYVWTGTRTDGTCGVAGAPATCQTWTSELSSDHGGIGVKWGYTFDLWNAYSETPCSSYIPIYCVEQ